MWNHIYWKREYDGRVLLSTDIVQGLNIKYNLFKYNIFYLYKETIDNILSNPPFIEWHVRFTMVTFNRLLIEHTLDIHLIHF